MADKLGPSLTDIDVRTSKYLHCFYRSIKYHYQAVVLNLEIKILSVDFVNNCLNIKIFSYYHCFHIFYFDDDMNMLSLQLSGKSPHTPHGIVEQGEVVCQEKTISCSFWYSVGIFFSPHHLRALPLCFISTGILSHTKYTLVENITWSSYFPFVFHDFSFLCQV